MEKRKNQDELPCSSTQQEKRLRLFALNTEIIRRFKERVGCEKTMPTETTFGSIPFPITLHADRFKKTNVLICPDVDLPRELVCRLIQTNRKVDFVALLVPVIDRFVNSLGNAETELRRNTICQDIYTALMEVDGDPHRFESRPSWDPLAGGGTNRTISTSPQVDSTSQAAHPNSVQDDAQDSFISIEAFPNSFLELLDPLAQDFTGGRMETGGVSDDFLAFLDNEPEVPVETQTDQELFLDSLAIVTENFGCSTTKAVEVLTQANIKGVRDYIFLDGIPYLKTCWVSAYIKILDYSEKDQMVLGIAKAAYVLLRQQFKEQSRMQGSSYWCPITTLSVKRATGCLYNIFLEFGADATMGDLCNDKFRYGEIHLRLPAQIAEIVDGLVFGVDGIAGEFEAVKMGKEEAKEKLKEQAKLWENYVETHYNTEPSPAQPPVEMIVLRLDALVVTLPKLALLEVWEKMRTEKVVEGSKQLFSLFYTIDEMMKGSVKGRKGNTVNDSSVQQKLCPAKLAMFKRTLYYFLHTEIPPPRLDSDWTLLNEVVKKGSSDAHIETFWEQKEWKTVRSPKGESLRHWTLIYHRNQQASKEKKRRKKDKGGQEST